MRLINKDVYYSKNKIIYCRSIRYIQFTKCAKNVSLYVMRTIIRKVPKFLSALLSNAIFKPATSDHQLSTVATNQRPVFKMEPIADQLPKASTSQRPVFKMEPIADQLPKASTNRRPVFKMEPIADLLSKASTIQRPVFKMEQIGY